LANLILSDLKDLIKIEETEEEYYKEFETEVASALTLDREELRRRASSMPEQPERVLRTICVFNRNPYVVAEVLRRAEADGCEAELCTNRKPFFKLDGLPFLEVHHRLPLAQGGLGTVENAMALCPNCHRKEHYGGLRASGIVEELHGI
jgi:5-methylcytosine-specific restriction protein A